MRLRLKAVLVLIIVLAVSSFAGSNYIRKGDRTMGVMVIVGYKPKPGKEERLLELTKEHVPILRGLGLATDRPAYAMRAKDGTVIEVFEWKSKEAISSAHENPKVLEMWKRYEEACEYTPLSNLQESKDMFAEFVPIEL